MTPSIDQVKQAAEVLRRGGLVIMPTDTVYGLAADSRHPAAVRRLFEVKHREGNKPIALLAAGLDDVEGFGAALGPEEQRLARAFWPGPLTLVLGTPQGPDGFRVPNCPEALALLREVGGLLRVTSANLSGEPPALTARDAARAVGDAAGYILDAGPSRGGVPSTVVRVEEGRAVILRVGALGADEVTAVALGRHPAGVRPGAMNLETKPCPGSHSTGRIG